MSETDERIRRLYSLFNDRKIEPLGALLHPDVDWPNAWEGGEIHGRDAVVAYWQRQWDAIEPTVTPTAITLEDDGRVTVEVDQRVCDKSGAELSHDRVLHVYTFDGDLVTQMEVNSISSS